MLEALVMAGYEFFGSDNPRICKIPGPVAQTAGRRKHESFLFLLIQYPGIDHLTFSFVRAVNGARFIKILINDNYSSPSTTIRIPVFLAS